MNYISSLSQKNKIIFLFIHSLIPPIYLFNIIMLAVTSTNYTL